MAQLRPGRFSHLLERALARLRRVRRPKDVIPKSLFGRAMLIIVLPVAIMQIAVSWAFFDAHWATVTSRLSESVAGDVAVVLDLYEQQPGADGALALQPFAERTMGLSLVLEEAAQLPTSVRSSFFRVLDRTLRSALSAKLEHAFWFDTTRYPAYVEIRVQVTDGVLRLIVPRDQVFATTGHIFLFWIVLATTLLTAVSLIYIRNQAKPIERLAAAAERFGRGQDAPDFRPAGAREVRQAAHAFMKMRARIQRHIDQRTTVLAGVSHDLRTPLTRFRLQLALLPDGPEKEAMKRDVADMAAILEEYLAFARGVGGEEPAPVDIGALVSETAAHAAQGAAKRADGAETVDIRAEIDVAEGEDLVLPVRAHAVKRCVENLITNAIAHGGRVAVTARRASGAIEIDIDDDGPGIPRNQREEAFRPFHQLTHDAGSHDRSRPRRAGAGVNGEGGAKPNRMGVGLGLAIARDLARSHGGDVTLSESPLGGLRARVRLPA